MPPPSTPNRLCSTCALRLREADFASKLAPSFDLLAVLGIGRRAGPRSSIRVKVVHNVVCFADALKFAVANRRHSPAIKHISNLAGAPLMKAPIFPNHVTSPGANADSLESIRRLVIGG